ncbi:MAG TPA: ammonia channel protein, partial [Gammaproteobacteria bacterium]|nr:ammonia channel protein [Gammaproteobacteria bacterium]
MKFGVSDWIQQVKRIAVVALILGVNWANADELNTGDTAWILTSTALVLFMTIPGLSLFYGGLVRSRNVLSVLMQCFSITCVVTILWLLIGYSLAFDVGNSFIGGLSKGLFAGVDEGAVVGTIPESSFAIFQLTFAIITPALIVGGFAERMRFVSVLAFTALWSIIVYAPITHWVWAEGGWLFERGFLDFAGGSVVHMTAGTAAVVTALVLKARQGFPTQPMPPHNMTLTMAGAGMLWVGWFGFNGGSAL